MGIEVSVKQLMSEEGSPGIITMLQTGIDIAALTEVFLMSGVGAGKWTPDFALLLAGPVSHIIYLMGKAHGVKCELGIERKKPRMTKAFFDGMKVDQEHTDAILDEIKTSGLQEKTETAVSSMGGFMGAKPPVEGAV